jgi:pimeloyl-ACP methyl ester carboxylesterase
VITQAWLVRGPVRLLTVRHPPIGHAPIGCAVLFSGFSHSMCDVDYLMSRLARRLSRIGIFAVQVEPRGHGDSSEPLADVDLDTLRDDISSTVNDFSRQFPENLFLIGRGLTATLIAEQFGRRRRLRIAALCPYELPGDFIVSRIDTTRMDAGRLDASTFFGGTDYQHLTDFAPSSVAVLNALGASPTNLYGESMSPKLITQLADFDASSALRTASSNGALILHGPIVSEPSFQLNLISKVTQWTLNCCTRETMS